MYVCYKKSKINKKSGIQPPNLDSRGFRLSPRGKPAKYTRPGTGLGGGDVRGEVWPFLFLNLSQDVIVVLLMYFGTLGDG